MLATPSFKPKFTFINFLASLASAVCVFIKSCKSNFKLPSISNSSNGLPPVLKLLIMELRCLILVFGTVLVKPSDCVKMFLICGFTASCAKTNGSRPNLFAAAVIVGVSSIVPGLLPINKMSPTVLVNLYKPPDIAALNKSSYSVKNCPISKPPANSSSP